MNRYRDLLSKRGFCVAMGRRDGLGARQRHIVRRPELLIERGGTPADVGWLAAVYTAPVIVGGIAAGVILDRFHVDRGRRWSLADDRGRSRAIMRSPS
jgi:hypothetical protein